ncbi:MAG TPA: recombinase family protein [Pseudonocardia sp.]
MLMSVLGGMSESERQHVQARVRAAMDAQVVNEGRHQGGRAPYGYVVVDAGTHPNPRKAAEGYRLRVLALDELTAPVVARIFAEYLDDRGDRAIATGLNRDGIPCPSARWPDQNRHRLGDGWQGTTVRAILDNPRYTGYAVFGRWTKHETLLDPDDVAAGHVVRFRKAAKEAVVRSRRPAHPAIVSVATFTQAQLLRRSRASGGLPARRKLERGPKDTKYTYVFKGRVRCGVCKRRMEGTPRGDRIYYRCAARSLAPGSPVLADHPKNVYLPERVIVAPVNDWLGGLFDEDHRTETAQLLAGVDGSSEQDVHTEHARRRVSKAETHIRRLQEAIKAGANPAALVDALNQAHEERSAARALLDSLPLPQIISAADVEALVDHLGGLNNALTRANPSHLERLYRDVGLEMVYDPRENSVDVTIRPPLVGVVSVSEGGLEPPRPLIGH